MKKYIVRLSDEERKLCEETIDRLAGSSQKGVAPASCSKSTPTERLGRTGRSLTPTAAVSRRSRTRADGACWRASSWPCAAGSAATRRCPSC